jgi:hypothetical protein
MVSSVQSHKIKNEKFRDNVILAMFIFSALLFIFSIYVSFLKRSENKINELREETQITQETIQAPANTEIVNVTENT